MLRRVCELLDATVPRAPLSVQVPLCEAIMPSLQAGEARMLTSAYDAVVAYDGSRSTCSDTCSVCEHPEQGASCEAASCAPCKAASRAQYQAALCAPVHCEAASCAQNSPPAEEMRRHLQRKMVGLCLHRIFLGQDFISSFCYEDERGYLTNLSKQMMVQINLAMRPWLLLLGGISTHPRLNKIAKWVDTGNDEGDFKIYARVNIFSPNDLYVGRTADLPTRMKQHFYETCRHRVGAPNPCRGCREHAKYRKHRSAQPHEWMTIAIGSTLTKNESTRWEQKLIRTLKPNLNSSDKPFWMLKETYASQHLYPRSKKGNPKRWPKQRLSPPQTPSTTRPAPGPVPVAVPRLLTKFNYEAHRYLNMGTILASHIQQHGSDTKTIDVTITPGKYSLTNWRRLKERYGHSWVATVGGGYQGALQLWDPQITEITTIAIRPEITQVTSRRELQSIFDDLNEFRDQLQTASDDDLEFYWRIRNTLEKDRRYKARTMIWNECVSRYGCGKAPITIKIPYFKNLDVKRIKQAVRDEIERTDWPFYLKNWHFSHLSVTTKSQPPITQILCNVTAPWTTCDTCCCSAVKAALARRGYEGALPEIDGHLFFTSRDYDGPHKEALSFGANNVPSQTQWDLVRAWADAHKQFPTWLPVEKNVWLRSLKTCVVTTPTRPQKRTTNFPTTKAVYALRKDLKGLIIGPIDKNLNELSFCCPTLYAQAWTKAYGTQTGYERIYPCKFSRDKAESFTMDPPSKGKVGNSDDLLKHWEAHYKKCQWNKFASFSKHAAFNRPYILFKAKNIIDHTTRTQKWSKARPIAPQTKHPMKQLFHLSGKAWAFITANIPGEHFTIPHGGYVGNFLNSVEKDLGHLGQLRSQITDIEGCFPNMDKKMIREGLQTITQSITAAHGHHTVYVPKLASKPCRWKSRAQGYVALPFTLLHDILDFALNNTIIKDFKGQLWKQVQGIPMGDPHSPGMAIGACAAMENTWMQTLGHEKQFFRAKRYMDDVLLFYVKHPDFDDVKFLENFNRSECYPPPLRLEDASNNTFLETTFEVTPCNHVRSWLKNENQPNQPPKIWRYAHFHSPSPFSQKRGVLISCLKKIDSIASDATALYNSAMQKLREFCKLSYPRNMLWAACTTLGVQTRDRVWFEVRDDLCS